MADTISVSDARYTPASKDKVATGMLGYTSFVLYRAIRLDSVQVRRTRDGRLTLSWPKVRDGSVPEQLEINIEDTPSGGVLVNCQALAVSELPIAGRCLAVQEFVQAQGGEIKTAQVQAEFPEWGERGVFKAIQVGKERGLIGSEKKGIIHAK